MTADISVIRGARGRAAEAARELGATAESAADVALAVSEAVTNAVMHAFPDRAPGTITIGIERDGEQLTVVVDDDGVGMRARQDSPGAGYGLLLIDAVTLGTAAEPGPRGGHRLTMRFGVARPAAPG